METELKQSISAEIILAANVIDRLDVAIVVRQLPLFSLLRDAMAVISFSCLTDVYETCERTKRDATRERKDKATKSFRSALISLHNDQIHVLKPAAPSLISVVRFRKPTSTRKHQDPHNGNMCQQLYHRYMDCGHLSRAKLERCPEAEAGTPRRKRLRCYEGVECTSKTQRGIPESHIDRKDGMCPTCAVTLYEEFNAVLKRWEDEVELAAEIKMTL